MRSAEDARFFMRWVDRLEAVARADTNWNTAAERQAVLEQFARARAVYATQAGEGERP